MLNALTTENSPFSERQIDRLRHGLGELDAGQSAWLSGYLAGRLTGQLTGQVTDWPDPSAAAAEAAHSDAGRAAPALEVLYASETGNGQGVADRLAQRAIAAGVAVKARTLDGYRPADLARLRRAAFVISTHGEGDPPEEARELFEYLESPRAVDLSRLEFCVLALGDRSYEKFCEAGRRLETLLLARGARALAPRVDCDIDFAAAAEAWSESLIAVAEQDPAGAESRPAGASVAASATRLSVVEPHSEWTRARPFAAEVLRLQRITGRGSGKDVHHLELSLAGSGIRYEPGDALGIWPLNDEESVAAVLELLGIGAEDRVESDGQSRTMREWLLRHRELTRLTPDTVRAYAGVARDRSLARLLGDLDGNGLRRFIEQRQFADLVEEFPAAPAPAELLRLLRPLSPRSYSIASSQEAVGEEVHLAVATLVSEAIGKPRRGVASGHLNYRLQPGDQVGVYLEPNRRFRLPANRSAPLIMIGVGTGVAPFRAFMQQLEAEDRAAQSWLIFGNPHLRCDFLYQREWLRWREQGLLTRIDAAFSRDQAHKRYVQDVVTERAAELADWLDRGAHLFVCGSLAMGQSVEQTLERHVTPRLAAGPDTGLLAALRRQRRFARDLY